MADFVASLAAMVGALVIADLIVHKSPAAARRLSARIRAKKRAHNEKKLLKKLQRQARRRGAAPRHEHQQGAPSAPLSCAQDNCGGHLA